MRLLLCAALAAAALPALAQDVPEAEAPEVEIEIESDERVDGPVRFRVEQDDGRHVIIRRRGEAPGAEDEEVFEFRMPAPDAFEELSRLGERFFRVDGEAPRLLREFSLRPGVSPETRERMRALQDEARDLAREARRADDPDRDEATRRLDAVLGELFDVRGQARQEEADALRERARALMEEADEAEAALRDRRARRQALIDARRAELLGETATSDW